MTAAAHKTLEEVRQGYDHWYREERGPAGFDALDTPWYQWVRRALPPLHGKRVLEIACGRGALAEWMARQGARVTACEISLVAIQQAAVRGAARYSLADIHRLPFAADSFDVVVSCETLEHTLDLDGALAELFRVTRPGGRVLLTTPNYLNVYGLYRAYLWLRGRPFGTAGVQPVDRLLFSFGMVRRVRRAGARILHTEGMLHYVLPARRRLRWVEENPALSRLCRFFALHFGIVAETSKSFLAAQ